MNNVITILVDSVFSDCIGVGRTKESSTPFIDSLIGSSLFCKNIYSYGPYTDAATKGLFCGNKSLDDYGYFFGLNSSEYNHYRIFKEEGYETIGLYYPYYLISSKVEQYIDHSIYISGFRYSPIWEGKLRYYSDKLKRNNINKLDYEVLEKFVDMLFDCWMLFYENVRNKESSIIIERIKNPNVDGKGLLYKEYKKYVREKKEYIDSMLILGMKHPLAKVNDYEYEKILIKEFVKSVFARNKAFCKKLEEKELLANIKNNRLDLGYILDYKNRGGAGTDKGVIKFFESFGMSLFGNKFIRYNAGSAMRQMEASMMNQIQALFSCIDQRNVSKPFYASMHTEEPHNRLMYFTYDIPETRLVDEELEYMMPLIENLGIGFKGNIIYQLSLRYVDLCLKRLFDGLKKRGLLENTTIMIMADHGSSYTYFPLRNKMINNFYLENYKTPLLIWKREDAGWKKKYQGMFQAEDVFATLFDIENIDVCGKMNGLSIPKNESGRAYIITEYMGPGCPVMTDRDVWMSITDNKYQVAVKCKLGKRLELSDIVEIYDLEKDPDQLYNKVNEKDNILEIRKLMILLGERYSEISSSARKYIKNIKTKKVIA